MTQEEAMTIRDQALAAHIEYGKQRVERLKTQVGEMIEECNLVARQVAAMEEARDILLGDASAPPEPSPTESGISTEPTE